MARSWVLRIALILIIIAAGNWLVFPEYRAAVQTYRLTDDPRKIELHASLGPGDIVVGTEVHENDRAVIVAVKARDVSKETVGSGDSHFVTVTLREPVGTRKVILDSNLPGLSGFVVPRVP